MSRPKPPRRRRDDHKETMQTDDQTGLLTCIYADGTTAGKQPIDLALLRERFIAESNAR